MSAERTSELVREPPAGRPRIQEFLLWKPQEPIVKTHPEFVNCFLKPDEPFLSHTSRKADARSVPTIADQ